MGLLILAFGNSFSESVKLQKLVFGNFVEQVAGVGDVGEFAVMIDEAVDDEREWLEAGGEDVSVDGTCEGGVGELGQVTIAHCPNVLVRGT